MIFIGSDHRGFELKRFIKNYLVSNVRAPAIDHGPAEYESHDDYVDFAQKVVEGVLEDPWQNRGILICGSGHGMEMTANKYKGIRAVLGFNIAVAQQSREHEDANVLVLPSDWLKPDEAATIVHAWLSTEYGAAERNQRRLDKLSKIEEKNFK